MKQKLILLSLFMTIVSTILAQNAIVTWRRTPS